MPQNWIDAIGTLESMHKRRPSPAVAEASAVGQLVAVGPKRPCNVAVDRCIGADFVLQPKGNIQIVAAAILTVDIDLTRFR